MVNQGMFGLWMEKMSILDWHLLHPIAFQTMLERVRIEFWDPEFCQLGQKLKTKDYIGMYSIKGSRNGKSFTLTH